MDETLESYAELSVDTKRSRLSVRFLTFTPHLAFVSILEREYDLIRENGLRSALIDLRLVPVYAAGSADYVRDVWFPTVAALGMKRVAFLVPRATLGKMSMDRAHKGVSPADRLSVEHFADESSALAWLSGR